MEPNSTTTRDVRSELQEHNHDLGQLPGWMFEGLLLLVVQSEEVEPKNHSTSHSQSVSRSLDLRMKRACNIARFAGANVTADRDDEEVTHVVIEKGVNTRAIRQKLSRHASCSEINVVVVFWPQLTAAL